jgi:hypothetical protein
VPPFTVADTKPAPDGRRAASRLIGVAQAAASIAGGVVAAFVAVEIGLRAFASPQGPPTPNIAKDSLVEDTLVRRQLREGVSVARFSLAGARLTGNTPIPGAPTVVLLGDSYVVAAAVGDANTMGSYVERTARASGVSLNVRQYGWSGASPSQYLLVADAVLRRWNPTDVVIAVSDNDFDSHALYEGTPRLRVNGAGDLVMLPEPPAPAGGSPRRSVLAALLAERTWVLNWRHAQAAAAAGGGAGSPVTASDESEPALPNSAQLAMMPSAIMHALSEKFGARLAIVYLAEVGVEVGDTASTIERRLFDACQAERARCVSTRASMLAARRAGSIVHGFFNTTPGNGHLNPAGHALVGREIWKLLRRRPAQTVAGEVR